VAEGRVELVGADALTEEEARVLTLGQPYGAATAEENDTWCSAMEKIARARERSVRLRVLPGGNEDLSPRHRSLLKLVARNAGRPVSLRGAELERAEDLAALGLVEIGPLGARITDAGQKAA